VSSNSNGLCYSIEENIALKMGEIELEPDRQTLSAAEENMISSHATKKPHRSNHPEYMGMDTWLSIELAENL